MRKNVKLINIRITDLEFKTIKEKANKWFDGNMTAFLKTIAINAEIKMGKDTAVISGPTIKEKK